MSFRLGTLFTLVIFFLLCIFAFFSDHHIVLRLPSTFYPQKVYIDKGDTIHFVNLTTSPVWPASGPHPGHNFYPEFDSRVNVQPFQSWKFTVFRDGNFSFHDHDAPHVQGVLIVGDDDYSESIDTGVCAQLPNFSEEASCMQLYFGNVADTSSYVHTLQIFNQIAPVYQDACHDLAHTLGKRAYKAYKNNELYEIGEESASCGFGFWHGLTTAMQQEEGIEASKEFCSGRHFESLESNSNESSCYHGIGIGLIPDPPPEHLWGAFETLANPAFDFCNTIEDSKDSRNSCMTGVFHALTVYMAVEQYGFDFTEDSFSRCANGNPLFEKMCFKTLAAELGAYTFFDVPSTVTLIRTLVPAHLFEEVFYAAMVPFLKADAPLGDFKSFVESCEKESNILRTPCILAVINKLFNNGIPGIEYQRAFDFCSDGWLTKEESDICVKEVLSTSAYYYSAEKVRGICDEYLPRMPQSSISRCVDLLHNF